jgi:hypothetical protein
MSKYIRRWLIAGGVLGVAAVGSSIAFATSTGQSPGTQDPLANISALSSSSSGLDNASARVVRAQNIRAAGIVGLGLATQARALPGTVDGKRVYVLPTDQGYLCVILEGDTEACSPALSAQKPAFIVGVDDGPGGVAPTFFGIAMDGVTQVRATVGGTSVSSPVKQNLFVFHGSSVTTLDDLSTSSATFADGTSVQVP